MVSLSHLGTPYSRGPRFGGLSPRAQTELASVEVFYVLPYLKTL